MAAREMVSGKGALMSSSMLRPPPRSGVYAASQTAAPAPIPVAMAGSRTPAPEWPTTTGRSPVVVACPAACRA